jgi:hypothetical protein
MLASDAGQEGPAVWALGAGLRRVPRAALPAGALVVVFSPLLDQRFVEALRDMRERGFTMLVVDVTHLAESGASPGVLRPQAGVLATGAGQDAVAADGHVGR